MTKCCTIIGFFAAMASILPALAQQGGCGGPWLAQEEDLIIAPSATCNISLQNGYLVLSELQLQPNDKISLVMNNVTYDLSTNVLPMVEVANDTLLVLKLDPKNPVYRRLTARLSKDCSHNVTLNGGPPPSVLQLPTPQILEKNTELACTLIISPPADLKLSVSILQLNLTAGSSMVILHTEGPNDTIPNGDKCDYIEQAGSQIVMTVKDKADTVVLQAEPVIASCSGESMLKEKSYLTLDLSKNNNYPDLECRKVVHYHGTATLVGHFNPNSSDSDSYLHVHNGGSSKSPTLLLQGPSQIKEGYYVTKAESLLIRYRNLTGQLLVNSTENSGYLSSPKNFSMGMNSVYLLELKGKAVVLRGPEQLKGPLELYSDYSDSTHLMTVPAGPLDHVLVSPTSRLMVKSAEATNLSLSSSMLGCTKMSLGSSDTYVLDRQLCSEQCQWVVPPSTDGQGELALHVSTAQLKDKDQAMLYVLGEKEPLMELRNEIRELYLPAKSGYRLEVSRNCSSGSVLRASYDIQPDCSAAKTVAPGSNLTLTSPNYPDHYPLNARCTTSLNTTGKVLLVTVSSLDLAPQHSLKVGWGSNSSVELEQAKDVLVPASSLQLTLLGRGDKQPLDPAGLTASGYSLSVLAADCGANLTTPSNSFNSSNASICVLIIEVGNGSLVNYTLSTPKGSEVKVYDGPSLLSPAATSQTGDLLSRTSSLVVVYRKLNATAPLTLKYTSYKCDDYCLNKVCMQPHWRCNGRNDCGDWSDELHCQGPAPTPQPKPVPVPPAGWSSGSFAAAIILSFIVGLSLAYAVPIMYKRYRMTPYEPFASTLE